MEVIKSIDALRAIINSYKLEGKKVGFVPTMGALHNGHLSLIKSAKQENEIVVCSIFVNPTQFNDSEDLDKYPRTLEADCQLLENNGCNIVFAPSVEMIYPGKVFTSFQFSHLDSILEGEYRDGHFSGVALVVSKLFNIVKPHRAYFGEKDLQQLTIIKQLVKDLYFDIEIIGCPIIREKDGLALSSRNQRLSEEERKKAITIYKSLQIAKKVYGTHHDLKKAKQKAVELIREKNDFVIDYFEFVNRETFEIVNDSSTNKEFPLSICVAAYLGEVRLIDNMSI